MADLSKKLKVEELDGVSWAEDKARRANKLATFHVQSPQDKGLLRQMQDNDIGRNFLEEILLKINSLKSVTDKARDNFDADNKLELQKILRAALKQNYEQKLFLKVAKEHGYEAAEECKGNEMEDGAMDDSMQKRYEDIKKKYDTKTAQPYRSTSFRKQQLYNEQAPAYPVPMQNQLVQQQGFPALAGWNQLGQMLQSQVSS